MPDMEKVVKGLAHCTRPTEYGKGGNHCMDCPYTEAIGFNQFKCNGQQMMKDALALLKEQETVEPKKVKGYNPPMYTIYEYECEKCKSPIINKQPFCMGCGRAVKWNEKEKA